MDWIQFAAAVWSIGQIIGVIIAIPVMIYILYQWGK